MQGYRLHVSIFFSTRCSHLSQVKSFFIPVGNLKIAKCDVGWFTDSTRVSNLRSSFRPSECTIVNVVTKFNSEISTPCRIMVYNFPSFSFCIILVADLTIIVMNSHWELGSKCLVFRINQSSRSRDDVWSRNVIYNDLRGIWVDFRENQISISSSTRCIFSDAMPYILHVIFCLGIVINRINLQVILNQNIGIRIYSSREGWQRLRELDSRNCYNTRCSILRSDSCCVSHIVFHLRSYNVGHFHSSYTCDSSCINKFSVIC